MFLERQQTATKSKVKITDPLSGIEAQTSRGESDALQLFPPASAVTSVTILQNIQPFSFRRVPQKSLHNI
jgi:hypothetical protein